MRALIPIILAGCCIALPVTAQDTQPGQDLAQENRELKAYAAKLEGEVSALRDVVTAERRQLLQYQQQLRDLRGQEPTPRMPYRVVPVPPLEPAVPHRIPQTPYRSAPVPNSQDHKGWQRRWFNGSEFYLIPVKDSAAALKSPTTRP